MATKAITLDFHNTIATCDRHFALEVRDLAPAVLEQLANQGVVPGDTEVAERARVAYRALRTAIIASGVEQDALACTLHALAAVNVSVPRDRVAAIIDTLMCAALQEAVPEPGIIDAVRALRARGLRCGIGSSTIYHPFLEWTLDRFELREALATIVTSASSGYYKTRPEIYTLALHNLGVSADEAIHVGDSYRFDVQGARRAGMRTIWYASTEQALTQSENEADATIADLATLPVVIATLDSDSQAHQRRRWWHR